MSIGQVHGAVRMCLVDLAMLGRLHCAVKLKDVCSRGCLEEAGEWNVLTSRVSPVARGGLAGGSSEGRGVNEGRAGLRPTEVYGHGRS